MKDHPSKPHLNVPAWLVKEWSTGRKDDIADVLRQCNFDKDTWYHVVSFLFESIYKTKTISNIFGISFEQLTLMFSYFNLNAGGIQPFMVPCT